ncbi:MAG: hypothetical protein A3I66_22865 [Burkholderiales bacterium RIFCSPLOWO2_02_FULL_57_36]|nr:MAG: hypothetical protein A3I66_22865 [Burkholderiales bacterium RIFCSPLOWO2_02_FULL_57_36]
MKKYLTVVAALAASATLMLAVTPAVAANVDINIGVPGVIVQPRPVYVQPRTVYVQPRTVYVQPNYDQEWSERRIRATEWRNNPNNHGQAVSAEAHARNDFRKSKKHNKRHGKNKHGH